MHGRSTPANTFETQFDRRKMQLEISRQSSGALLGRRLEPTTGVDGQKVTLRSDATSSVSGFVYDESFGGIGLEFSEPPPLVLGQEVTVSQDGNPTPTIVRHLSLSDRGTYRVGLQWQAVGLEGRDKEALFSTDDFQAALPGGLCVMAKLFEESRWQELKKSVASLGQEARAAGVYDLMPHVERLKRQQAGKSCVKNYSTSSPHVQHVRSINGTNNKPRCRRRSGC